MRTIIAGGRDFNDYGFLRLEVERFEEYHSRGKLIVVCGEARGADALGRKWAELEDREIVSFPADWDKHGRGAGYIRNAEMADFAEALIAFWDGKSRGTKNMIDKALSKGLVVKVVPYQT